VSANDPIFFLHHANIDNIWARWQLTYPRLASQYNQRGSTGRFSTFGVIFDTDLPWSSLWDTTGQLTPGNPLCYSYATPKRSTTGGSGTATTVRGGSSGTATGSTHGSNPAETLQPSSELICFKQAKKWASQMKNMENSISKAYNNLACQFATYISNSPPSTTDQINDFLNNGEIKSVLPQFYQQVLAGDLLGSKSMYIIDQSIDEIQRQLGLTKDGIDDNNMASLNETSSSESRSKTVGIVTVMALVFLL
jgi:hypothetical protein